MLIITASKESLNDNNSNFSPPTDTLDKKTIIFDPDATIKTLFHVVNIKHGPHFSPKDFP